MISKIFAKLKDPKYRKAFVASQINIAIPFQIRGLLKSRGWKQEDLAKRTGMLQPRISALLTPGKARPNIETLRRIAEAFDCGLEVRLVPFSALVHQSEIFDPENFSIPTFDEELRQSEKREEAIVAALCWTDLMRHRQYWTWSLGSTTKPDVSFADVGFAAPCLVVPRLSNVKAVATPEWGSVRSVRAIDSQLIQKGGEYVAA